MGLRAGVASDRGLVRPTNEDSFFLREGLYAVCDGMGGARGGEVASQMACLGLLGLNPESAAKHDLHEAIDGANRAIVHRGAGEDHLMGMGTTLTAALVKDGRLTLAHVGDSRAYLLHEGDLDQLTEDHSWVGEMVRRGELTPAQAAIHPHRNVITRVLGAEGDIAPDFVEMQVSPGDRILLCSDGLTGMVPDTDLLEILASGGSPQETAEMLVKAALAAGGEDNITVVIIDVTTDEDGGPRDPGQASGPLSSQILFGPSDRGSLVAASAHRAGKAGAGVRERIGRRITPPVRPVPGLAPRAARPAAETAAEARATVDTGEATAAIAATAADEDAPVETPGETRAETPGEASGEASGVAGSEPAVDIEPEPVPVPTAVPVPVPHSRPRRRLQAKQLKMFVTVLVIVTALAIAVGGFAFYNSTIYYVGKYSDGTVALYRGLPASVLGIDLSSVVQLGKANYDSLTVYEKQQVDSHSLVSEEEGQKFLGTLNGPL
jgi:serine/threonine protein phosphatase PrpC